MSPFLRPTGPTPQWRQPSKWRLLPPIGRRRRGYTLTWRDVRFQRRVKWQLTRGRQLGLLSLRGDDQRTRGALRRSRRGKHIRADPRARERHRHLAREPYLRSDRDICFPVSVEGALRGLRLGRHAGRPLCGLLFGFGVSVMSDAVEMVPTGRRADSLCGCRPVGADLLWLCRSSPVGDVRRDLIGAWQRPQQAVSAGCPPQS